MSTGESENQITHSPRCGGRDAVTFGRVEDEDAGELRAWYRAGDLAKWTDAALRVGADELHRARIRRDGHGECPRAVVRQAGSRDRGLDDPERTWTRNAMTVERTTAAGRPLFAP